MNRTVLVATADGSTMITREARVGVSGSAKDRRKQQRDGIEETWRVTNRYITHLPLHGSRLPSTLFTGTISIVPTAGVTIEMPELPGPPTITPHEFKPYIPPVVVTPQESIDERD